MKEAKVRFLSHKTYADDTMTGTSSKDADTMIRNLGEDADQVLRYMASNGLVANPKKTAFLVINGKKGEQGLECKDRWRKCD